MRERRPAGVSSHSGSDRHDLGVDELLVRHVHSCVAADLAAFTHLGQATIMFYMPKIPRQLSSPFGLLGDDAKLAFRSQPNGIVKLANVRVRKRQTASVVVAQLSAQEHLGNLRLLVTGR